jgi:hypothetical protein
MIARAWKQGNRIERDIWNIPVAADGEDGIYLVLACLSDSTMPAAN